MTNYYFKDTCEGFFFYTVIDPTNNNEIVHKSEAFKKQKITDKMSDDLKRYLQWLGKLVDENPRLRVQITRTTNVDVYEGQHRSFEIDGVI